MSKFRKMHNIMLLLLKHPLKENDYPTLIYIADALLCDTVLEKDMPFLKRAEFTTSTGSKMCQ